MWRSQVRLVAAWTAVFEHLERVLELSGYRYAQLLAGRQTVHQPFLVKRHQVLIDGELAEGSLDHVSKLLIAFAEHDAVGVVAQKVAHHLELVLRPMPRDQPIEKNVISGEGLRLSIGEQLVGLLVVGRR